jgi:hypothetical protein
MRAHALSAQLRVRPVTLWFPTTPIVSAMKQRVLAILGARCAALAALAIALCALLPAGAARAQLRNVDLAFRPPSDTRVVGFHVYVAASSHSYSDYRDDINFVPPVDAGGAAHYALTGLEQFADVYVSLKAYDATGAESAFSNEIMLAAQQQCLVTGCNDNNPCTTDTCTTTGCKFDPAPLRGTTCDDGNAMTFNDMCQSNGACSGTVAQCNVDADCGAPADICAGPKVCVAHMCQAGSTPRADNTTCNDNNASTKFDVCRSGVCRGFACGSDSQCSDGQACNGVERCVNNACVAGTPMVCNDGNQCNGTETCVGSSCVAGTPMQCPADDGPCFDAFCDPAQGCRVQIHPDGEMCTTSMSGASGQCASGVCVPMPTTPPVTDPNTPGHAPRPPTTSPQAGCSNMLGAASDVRQELSDGSETSRKIVWSAPMHPMGSVLQYHLQGASVWRSLRAVPQKQNGCMGEYAVTLSGLMPNYQYSYRVSGAAADGRVWTDAFMLTPGPATRTSKFKFAFFASNGLAASPQSPQAALVLDQIRKGRFPLVLGGGGYALSNEAIAAGAATNAAQAVAMWKDQAQAVTANALFAPALGDTEVANTATAEVAADYSEYMLLASTPQTPYGSYSYDFGATHFLAVNAPTLASIQASSTAGAAHLAWIEADLAAARAAGARWLIVYMHSDLFSSDKTDASVQPVRTAFGAILMRQGVNLVLSGEGDSYERAKPVRGTMLSAVNVVDPTRVTTATDGVVFVRAGSGGRTAFAPWLRPTPPTWSAFRDNAHAAYVQVTVSDKLLLLQTYGLDENGKRIALDTLKIY